MNRIFSALRLPVFVFGVVLFFVSQRYLTAERYYTWILSVSCVLILLGLAIALLSSISKEKAGLKGEVQSWRIVFIWQLVFSAGLGCYLAYLKSIGTSGLPESFWSKFLLGAWILLVLLGVFGGIGVEWSQKASGTGQLAEPSRVTRSGLMWVSIGVLFSFLVCINYAAVKKDKVFDLSYLKSGTPSSATMKIIGTLSDKLKISIFYPQDNEVRPYVLEYFQYLVSKQASKIELGFYDVDLNPAKAEEFEASQNGNIVFEFNKKKEKLFIGTKLSSAKSTLKTLDSKVQQSLLGLLSAKNMLYFSRGHGELSWAIPADSPLDSVKIFEAFLRSQNYTTKFWDLAEGSGVKVPDDAGAVVILGPKKPFLKEEAEALKRFLFEANGKLFVLLDGSETKDKLGQEGSDPLLDLLAQTGLKFNRSILANDKRYLIVKHGPVDRWFLFSNNFSTHESVSSLAKHDEKIAVVGFQAGFFETQPVMGTWKTNQTIRSFPETFNDENKNYAFDEGKEKRAIYTMGAVSVMESKAVEDKKDENKDKQNDSEKTKNQSKIVAYASSRIISDAMIRNPANILYIVDSLKWLLGQSDISGELSSEEDVKIQHTRKQDVVWFNATVLGVPALVLLVGFFATRRKSRVK